MSKINNKLDSFIANCTNQKKNLRIYVIQCASILICASFILKVSFWHFSTKATTNSQVATKHNPQEAGLSSALPKINLPIELSKLVSIPSMPSIRSEPLVSKIPSWQEGAKRTELVQFTFPDNALNEMLSKAHKPIALIDKVLIIPKNLNPKRTVNKPDNQFTIQLLASRNPKEIQSFKQRNKYLADTQIKYLTNDKGKWYILILGNYKNKNDARSHVKSLPKELAKLNPWIRSISGLENIG